VRRCPRAREMVAWWLEEQREKESLKESHGDAHIHALTSTALDARARAVSVPAPEPERRRISIKARA
jgi:hypothetical protein